MIEVEGLRKEFVLRDGRFRRSRRTVEAVRDISFRVEPGELVGYLGPERRRQVDDGEDADRDPRPDVGARPGRRASSRRGSASSSLAGSARCSASGSSSGGTCR